MFWSHPSQDSKRSQYEFLLFTRLAVGRECRQHTFGHVADRFSVGIQEAIPKLGAGLDDSLLGPLVPRVRDDEAPVGSLGTMAAVVAAATWMITQLCRAL